MIKHYIKFALRNFQSNKVMFFGSLATLCLGALCISLLFSYVNNELTMDNFHKRKEDTYMVMMKRSPKAEWSHPYRFISEDYPEVESATYLRFFNEDDTKLKYKKDIYLPQGIVADTSFFKVFDFNLKVGDENTVLNDPQTIILSEEFSKKIFGDADPIGQMLDFETRMYQGIHKVEGIITIPSNSSLTFDYLIPEKRANYGRSSTPFIKAKASTNIDLFKDKIKDSNNKVPNVYPQLTESTTSAIGIGEIYFSQELRSFKNSAPFKIGNKKNVDILLIIMLVILLVSILNYSNIQIVNINTALRNIGISKQNGASKQHLVGQKIIETLIIIVAAAAIISLAHRIILPWFNNFANIALTPTLGKIFIINTLVITTITLIGLVYPILIINRFSANPKGSVSHKLSGKQVTVVLQYAMAFILLISSVVVNNQLKLMLDKDLGFNDDGIMKVKLFYEPPYNPESRKWSKERRMEERKAFLKIPSYINEQLVSFPCIELFSQGGAPIDIFTIDWKPKTGDFDFETLNSLAVTPQHQNLFNFTITEGRFFETGVDKQRGKKIVINEAAQKHWGIEDIGSCIIKNRNWGEYEIIGVVKDFNYEHLSAKPKPLIMVYFEDPEAEYFIKFNNDKTQEGVKEIEALFKEINPNNIFKYSFLSDDIKALYQKEKRLSEFYSLFTIIALLISTIGLFTIALYDTRKRTKEIGIRKVNGATISEILLMLNKDFIKWVAIAFVIAVPIAYYAMSKWLENFAYKTELSWWIFALAGVLALGIALLTVSWQSWKAARRNPIESLRYE